MCFPCSSQLVQATAHEKGFKRKTIEAGKLSLSISSELERHHFYTAIWTKTSHKTSLDPRDGKVDSTVWEDPQNHWTQDMHRGRPLNGTISVTKSSLNIGKFMVHVLLKPGMENFEHYLTSVWDECNYAVVWTFFGIVFLWYWNENWPFPVLWPLLSFPDLLAYWTNMPTSSFRIWNSSTEIPSPPLALFIVMLPKAHLTSHSRISDSRWVIIPSWLSGSWGSFLYSSVYSFFIDYTKVFV